VDAKGHAENRIGLITCSRDFSAESARGRLTFLRGFLAGLARGDSFDGAVAYGRGRVDPRQGYGYEARLAARDESHDLTMAVIHGHILVA
jgi:hypothetical protein